MKTILKTLCLGVALLPAGAQAEEIILATARPRQTRAIWRPRCSPPS